MNQVSKSQLEKKIGLLLRDNELRGYVDYKIENGREYLVIKKSGKPDAPEEFRIPLADNASLAPSAKNRSEKRKVAINPAGTGGLHNRRLENTVTDIFQDGKHLGTIDRGELTLETAMKVKEKLDKFQVETTRYDRN